ncbi:vanadium-dependent haloperoxidase [Piscinibacter koreensis]|uniref:Phosphatase PAP2 family protein n=1 Tax=Piscinibacter koreensis TaxID=2742824 RepID=A0A7Y6NK98_9BURK|nr:vanadium-dependent haloperoxidase [Schlegelella koreensis]NUZ04763.1 phosphatase PAP2 family protein [Schlegelella koreensis]
MSSFRAAALAAGAFLGLCGSAGALPANASVVAVWNEAALQEIRLSKLGPPVVARALAVAHTCMYDAWVPYDARAVASTTSIARRPASEQTAASKAAAVSYAAYRCLANLFPSAASTTRLTNVMSSLGYDPAVTTTDPSTPAGVGNSAAAGVIASRSNDGANQAGGYADTSGYMPRNAPMAFCLPTTVGTCPVNIADALHWQPLINDKGVLQSFVAPHWENVRPFALTSAAQFDTLKEIADGPAYARGDKPYKADVDNILSYSRNLTAQQKLIVEYWADGPASELPPGHWSMFAQYVSQRDANSIDKDVKMFFAMQNASFDAGIVAWHLKRKFDGVRPITAIRYLKQGTQVQAWGGPGRPIETIDGGKWSPYNPGSNLTPSFPGYLSGHSTFSAASATALRAFTGTDLFGLSTVIPANYGRVEPGVPAVPTTLSYPTYTDAVTEAGMSRLYAGIHFADDNKDGQMLGNLSGKAAWLKSFTLFTGALPVATYASGSKVTCQNQMLLEQTYASVTVPAGARCVLAGTRVRGPIDLGSGASIDMSDANVEGDVTGQAAAAVNVTGGSVNGSIVVYLGKVATLAGTSVGGSVQLGGNAGPLALSDLRVRGDIQLYYNQGSSWLLRNAGRKLQCQGNQPAPVGSYNQGAKEDQCQNL